MTSFTFRRVLPGLVGAAVAFGTASLLDTPPWVQWSFWVPSGLVLGGLLLRRGSLLQDGPEETA